MATVNSTASSQVAYSYLQSKNKIGGLVSGMDIDSIMEKLMKAESAQMEKLQQQKQKYEWKRDAYREVNTKLNTYQTNLFDNYGKYSNWVTKTPNVSSSSAVNIKASATASGNLSITGSQVATSGTSGIFTSDNISQSQITATTKLSTVKTSNNSMIQGSVFGEAINGDSTVQDVLNALNKDNKFKASVANGKLSISAVDKQAQLDDDTKAVLSDLGFDLKFSQVSDKVTYQDANNEEKTANTTTKMSDLGITATTIKIQVGDSEVKTIDIADTDTVGNVLTKIKDQTGLTATMSDGVISISSNDQQEIKITSDSANNAFLDKFNLKDSLLASSTSKIYSTDIPTAQLSGTNTIAELMGGNDKDTGVFTLRTITETGEYKDTEITYNVTDTINSLISKINSSSAGATAVFNNGKLSISANNTGKRTDGGESVSFVKMDTSVSEPTDPGESATSEAKAQYQKDLAAYNKSQQAIKGQGLFQKLGVVTADNIADSSAEIGLTTGGSNAKLTVNGITYEQTSNNFSVAGYNVDVTEDLGVYNASGDLETPAAKPVTVSSTTDIDSIVDKVKAFVTSYNELIADLNKSTSEKKQVGYNPLTDAQKAEMSTAEIEKWETAAKAGLLKGDSNLNKVISSMRNSISQYGTNTSSKETLYSIGISSSKTWSENGKLEIDEDKLRAALEKDPEVAARIFAGDSSQGTKGLVSELRTTAQDAVKNIEVSSGKASSVESTYSLGKTIASLNTKIDDWKDRLKDIENRYWAQFTAMETAIQKANNQSSIFSS